ncbi:MAG: outer membrane protein assembly factor BamA [Oligoflexia bacterium]|nr:outer membrane protein assembly factor BamA [Oligoflexia bacterium]
MWILILSIILNIGYAQAPLISRITVKGNKKVSSDAIRAKIVHRKGETLRPELVREEIGSIFKLGYFDDIKVYKDRTDSGINLIYEVKEKPIVSSIVFEGNSEVDKDDLEKELDIKPYTVLNISEIKKAKAKLLHFYEEKGFYLATIKDELRDAPKDEEVESDEKYLELVFKISENSKIRVKKITLLGNKNIPDSELKGIIQSQENGPFSWMSGSGNYRESIVDIDRERLAFYYTTKGYPLVQVKGPITHVTPDKKWIYLTYSITEGDKYYFGKVNFKADDLLFSEEELREKLIIKEGEVYNSMNIKDQIISYQNLYGDKGYAFTNVVPLPTYDDEKKIIDVVFEIDKGRKVYFGEFIITGNNKTRDKVIRREMRIHEGELYNYSRKELSKQKIMALGFFDDVTFHQYVPKTADGSKPDIVNIDVKVKERTSTGQFMITAGYSTYEGFLTQIQVQENNFLGYGQVVTVMASLSKVATIYRLSFFDPYFLDSNWAWGLSVFRERMDMDGYSTLRVGFDTRFGYPITDFVKMYFTYKLEDVTTQWIEALDNIFDEEADNGISSSVIYTIERDKRNNRLDPTNGHYQALSVELAGLGGDRHFVKTILDGRYYTPLFWKTVARARFLYGNIGAYGGERLPVNERFLMGGINSLRGFYMYSMGPTVKDNEGVDRPIGGLNEILWTAELEFSILAEAGIRGVVFFDMGNAFNSIDSTFTTDIPLRANWGLGFRWHSPIGPLRFEWGVPIARKPNENPSVFQFTMGPSF